MSFWLPQTFREVTAGRWLVRPEPDPAEMELTGLSTDTRTLQAGQAFCALVGPNFDGHDFLQKAVDAGSPLLIVQREDAVQTLDLRGAYVLLVDDTLGALGRLAAHYRRGFAARVIAITGSVGKTTTRQMIHAVLGTAFRGIASPHSYNNHIGVPLTLLSVRPTDRYVVVEAGTSAPGEISRLARWIEPDIAIITHIGPAHTDKLIDTDTIAREKASLLSHLRDDGLAIVNGDSEPLRPHLKPLRSLITFGQTAECDLRLTDYQPTPHGAQFEINERASYMLPTLGRHSATNAMAAVAVGRHMNLTDEQIAEGLKQVELPAMRLQTQRCGAGEKAVTIINDAYNANPDSMTAALGVLAEHPAAGRRIAVLGDMLELGSQEQAAHQQVGKALVKHAFDLVICIGRRMQAARERAAERLGPQRVHGFDQWSGDLPARIADLLQAGDVVLIKGSRDTALERLVPAIEARFGTSASVSETKNGS